jgi:transcription elongation factor SPT6
LWAVFNLDKKWLLLRKRKMALDTYYQKRFEEEFRRVEDETRIALNRQLFNSISQALAEAKSEREVDDVDAKFNLHFPSGEADTEEGQFKRPKRKSLYSICYKAGLWEVANKFGYSAEQFGQLLTLAKLSVVCIFCPCASFCVSMIMSELRCENRISCSSSNRCFTYLRQCFIN